MNAIIAANDRADGRAKRERARFTEGMRDGAELAQDMAAIGLIDKAAADETSEIARLASEKFGAKPATSEEAAHRFAKDQLKAIIQRIERLEEEKKALSDDIKDVYGEAKGTGFDVKALKTIVRMRKQDADERQEQETILETYMQALGMI
jgi:uncharacterized protein (UPF0335 family)